MNSPGSRNAWWEEGLSNYRDGIQVFKDVLSSVNIVFAFASAILFYISKSQILFVPKSNLNYYLLRAAIRVDDLLSIRATPAISTSAVARSDYPVHRIGLELVVILTISAASALIYVLLRCWNGSSISRIVTDRAALFTSLFALPVCCLSVSAVTWDWTGVPGPPSPNTFWRAEPRLPILAAEVLSFSFLVFFGKHPRPLWLVSVLFFIHYSYWTIVLWPTFPIARYQLTAPFFFLLAFPLSGFVWLLCASTPRVDNVEANGLRARRRSEAWIAAGALSLLLTLWLPVGKRRLAAIKDKTSLSIHMSRGPCYGSCPEYTLTIDGAGVVEYDGIRFVKIKGHEEGRVGDQQLVRILQNLDRADFSGLEDRAFRWCFDTPSVAVSVSTERTTKKVVSDEGCVGVNAGPQERFVEAAREIDLVVGSDQWVLCDGRSCR
jgi:hypothetical protein